MVIIVDSGAAEIDLNLVAFPATKDAKCATIDIDWKSRERAYWSGSRRI